MRSPKKPPLFATRAIHAGQPADPQTGAVITPIYATSTYAQESPGKHKGLDYGRSHNPTRWAYERCVADLEGATDGFAFASGMAATSTVLELLDSGSHWVQRPIDFGFDVVVHSATKYLNGHSDIVNGVAVTKREDLAEKLAFLQNAVGAVPSPFDAFLVTRGLKTLALRMQRHCENA